MTTKDDAYYMIDRFLRNNLGDDDYAEYSASLDALAAPATAPSQPAPHVGESAFESWYASHPKECETIIDNYVEDYVLEGDEGTHAPDEFGKTVIKDAIMGLLADPDWHAAWCRVIADSAPAQPERQDTLCDRLQQKCSDWKAYWRASDAHGVILSQDQANELLRDALGVEVEISLPSDAIQDLRDRAVGMLEKSFPATEPERKPAPMHEGEIQAAWLGQNIDEPMPYTFELGIRSAERFNGIVPASEVPPGERADPLYLQPATVQPERKPMTDDETLALFDRVKVGILFTDADEAPFASGVAAAEHFHGIGEKP